MTAIALRPSGKKPRTMRTISVKINSNEKFYLKCFEISQLIPQIATEFFFMP